MVKTQIAETLKERLVDVAERGRVIGQALKVRADLAATRRRLRATYAELGEEVYGRIVSGELDAADSLAILRQRIDAFKEEVRERELELRQIMRSGLKADGADNSATGGRPWRAS